ncbi:MAG: lytic transglycosylase domain-containing protein [Nitrospira sp.]|nr:lytic transglycosylase domain-containing protein [Nitrospira sp.]
MTHRAGTYLHPRRRSRHRLTLTSLWRFTGRRWRDLRAFLRAVGNTHPVPRLLIGAILIGCLWLILNWTYHAINKPAEVLFPLEDALDKRPAATWQEYGPLFREHSTAIITPDLLAALAQVEGAGNPVARTYWRWRLSWNPFDWYRPASSAVGMFQLTDGTFREAKRYCIHNHVVVEDGPWNEVHSCWFNSLYTRIVPSHAIELTAALLDRQVAAAIGSRRNAAITRQQKQDLAALIHLCGAGAGHAFAARGFHLTPHQKCGDHNAGSYLARVNGLKLQFARLATGASLQRLVKPR